MSQPFRRFEQEITQATDERTRRELLARIGSWRVDRLADMAATREASYALAQVYEALGDHENACKEAKQLMALCRADVHISKPEVAEAERLHRRLARTPEVVAQERANARQHLTTSVREAVDRGDFAGARRLARGKHTLRFWIQLKEILAKPADERAHALLDLTDALEAEAFRDSPAPTAAAPAKAAQSEPTPAARREREPRKPRPHDLEVEAAEAALAQSPDTLDALAAERLRAHVQNHGTDTVAPWWFGFVARALAWTDGTQTRAAIAELQGAFAVTAYAEPGFSLAVELLKSARTDGWSYAGLRRGLGGRGGGQGEFWRLMLTSAQEQTGCVVLSSGIDAATPESTRAHWLRRLTPRHTDAAVPTVLFAPGSDQEAWRAAARQVGFAVSETPEAALSALKQLLSTPVTPNAAPTEAQAPVPARKPGKAQVLDTLRRMLSAAEAPAAEALTSALQDFYRLRDAFDVIDTALTELTDADARLADVLTVLHAMLPADSKIYRGIKAAILMAARFPEGHVAALLGADDALAQRWGGASSLEVSRVWAGVLASGWEIKRTYGDISRQKIRENPALEALVPQITDFWQAEVNRADAHATLFFLQTPTPEAWGAVELLAHGTAHVCVVPHATDTTPATALLLDSEGWQGRLQAGLEAFAPAGTPA